MRKFCAALCLAYASLWGEIHEIDEMIEVFKYVDNETLVLMDLDNTTMQPIQYLGSDEWFEHQIHMRVASGTETNQAVEEVWN